MALSSPSAEALANGLAGALGAAIGCFVVAPLGLVVTVKTSVAQAKAAAGQKQPDLSALGILRARVEQAGPLGIWRGEWLNAVANFQSKFGFFTCYFLLASWWTRRFGSMGKATSRSCCRCRLSTRPAS
eukprot:SAG22_NODE_1275_length_4921_cov_1.871215_3_plen_129_part_00